MSKSQLECLLVALMKGHVRLGYAHSWCLWLVSTSTNINHKALVDTLTLVDNLTRTIPVGTTGYLVSPPLCLPEHWPILDIVNDLSQTQEQSL